jgi:hypothetical protein
MSGLLELAWFLVTGGIAIARRTRSFLLGGVLVGIVGGACGAVALGSCGYLCRDLGFAGPYAWLEWAFVGAALLGYPLGALCGIVIIGKRRGQTGSAWLALLGAFVGAGLGVGLYQGFQAVQRLLFDMPSWARYFVLLTPIVLIPSLASLGYGYGLTLRWPRRLRRLASDAGIVQKDRSAAPICVAAPGQPSSRSADSARSTRCPNCDASNAADSGFCGECDAPLLMVLTTVNE